MQKVTATIMAYADYLLEVLGDLYSDIRTVKPSGGKTGQESMLEVHCAYQEACRVSASVKTESRVPLAAELRKLAARCVAEAAQLLVVEERDARTWADFDKAASGADDVAVFRR